MTIVTRRICQAIPPTSCSTHLFGIVAMVAMTPLITIQIMGVIFKVKENKLHKTVEVPTGVSLDSYGDMEIIEL